MNIYDVNELRSNLAQHISNLGVVSEISTNPAYEIALSEVQNTIGRFSNIPDGVQVKEDAQNISLEWADHFGNRYSFSIMSAEPNSFRTVRIITHQPHIVDGEQVNQKDIVENIAKFDTESGEFILITNDSTLTDANCRNSECHNSFSSKRRTYNTDGVMTLSEYKSNDDSKLSVGFEHTSVNDALYLPRRAFDPNMINSNIFSYSQLVRREYIDTARVVIEDNNNHFSYNGTTQLHGEHGYQEMNLVSGFHRNDVVTIPSLSGEEISFMLLQEQNPIVRNGLEKYAVGRENYSYDSRLDLSYKNSAVSGDANAMSRAR